MRLSRYFLPVLKETPADAQIVSHRYMLRAGHDQTGLRPASIPGCRLGYKVLKRIENIVHEEQIRVGPYPDADADAAIGRSLARKRTLRRLRSRKCSASRDRHDRDMLYGPTNEELITDIFRSNVTSYKRFAPDAVPHPVEIPRRDAGPRFGVMRGREFLHEGRL